MSTTPHDQQFSALIVDDTFALREAIPRSLARDGWEVATAPDAHALNLFVEVAHDLRSPLTSILCLAETLQHERSGEVNALQRRQLGLIYSAALGLSGLVSDVLELARGSDHLIEDAPTPFSLYEVLEGVASIAGPMAEEKGLHIDLSPIQPDRRLGHPVALGCSSTSRPTPSSSPTREAWRSCALRATGRAWSSR